ncbi:Endonuclease-reverse transcriptase [Operophtera brumata]|uniref:Endonuclease-reverse transcriptase n=1 Tax=Operophtera brumata TaxID=104452 RepID=A0A0L7L586_OPEBR|nr:Endonuclease-reverse transcriptase [Operophtera brumata]
MIRCKLSIAVNRNRRIIKSRNNIRDLPKVSGESAKYWENKFMDSLSTSVEIQKQYNKLESEIKLLLTQLPRNKKEENKLISQETKYLLDRRKSLYKGKRNKEKQSEITKLSKEINRNISHEKKKKRQKIFEKFISRTGALRKAYKELSDKSEWAVKLKNRRGKVLSRRPDIIKEATSFYKDSSNDISYRDEVGRCDSTSTDTEPEIILRSEIDYVIKTQKNDKAPGRDNIGNERQFFEVLFINYGPIK